MVSPFQGTPNIPLQLDSMTNSWIPAEQAEGGIIYSTRRSEPKPPVIPVKDELLYEFKRFMETDLVEVSRPRCKPSPHSQDQIQLRTAVSTDQ